MAFEKEYHKNLQFTLSEKRSLLSHAITVWMFNNGKLVGETYGIPALHLYLATETTPRLREVRE
jgi:hypothetical protein